MGMKAGRSGPMELVRSPTLTLRHESSLGNPAQGGSETVEGLLIRG